LYSRYDEVCKQGKLCRVVESFNEKLGRKALL